MRVASLRFRHGLRILAQRARVHMNSFEGIAGADGPTIRDLPVRSDFNAVRLAVDEVFVSARQDDVRRRRRGVQKKARQARWIPDCRNRCNRRRDRRKTFGQSRSISEFVGDQIFILDSRISDDAYKNRGATGSGKTRDVERIPASVSARTVRTARETPAHNVWCEVSP